MEIEKMDIKKALKDLVIDVVARMEKGQICSVRDENGKIVDVSFTGKDEDFLGRLRDDEMSYFNLSGEDMFKYTLFDLHNFIENERTF